LRQTVNFDSRPSLSPAAASGAFLIFLVVICHLFSITSTAVNFASVPNVVLRLYGNDSEAQR